ncbi:MAG: DUF6455 family protein [Roseovarius sp.]|nr:DUF6455 family protein [Roseovarius sp.]
MPITRIQQRHAELMERMATALGLDLDVKIMEGQLDIEALDDAVLRCTGCADPDGCDHWLAAQQGIAAGAPGTCRNLTLFDMLKRGTRV